jgi:integral membrane protein
MKQIFSWFRKIGIAEGYSFLILLFIAMPLKYIAQQPMGVTVIGGLHGVLFVAFIYLAYEVKVQYRKTWSWLATAVLVSFLPFGTLFMDKQWKKEEDEVKRKA